MNSLSFLRQMLQDVRHQKMRTLLTLLGITWGTVSVALLVAFGEGLEIRIRKNQKGPRREHRDRVAGAHLDAVRGARQGPAHPDHRGGPRGPAPRDPGRALLRRVLAREHLPARARPPHPRHVGHQPRLRRDAQPHPAGGGRYVNDLDVDRRRRVVFLGDKLKQDLFGDAEAVGQTVMIDNVPFLVIGVLQRKAQDSSYSGRDKDKAFIPDTTYKGLFSERYVDNFIFQAPQPSLVPGGDEEGLRGPRAPAEVRPHATRKRSACGTRRRARSSSPSSSSPSARFLGVIGSFTLIVGGIGVSNIMYVVVEERTREIGVKLAVGAKPRFIQTQFLLETLTLTAVGGLLGFLITLGILAVFPFLGLDEYVGTAGGLARSSSSPPPPSSASSASSPATSPPAGPRSSTRSWRSSSHEIRGRRTRPRPPPVPGRPRPPDEADRPHRPRDRLGHALDRAAALLRRGPQAVARPREPGTGREHRRRLAGGDDEGLDGPALGPPDPDQGGGPRAPALPRSRRSSCCRPSTRGRRRSRSGPRRSTSACAGWTRSSARCATSTRSPGAAS